MGLVLIAEAWKLLRSDFLRWLLRGVFAAIVTAAGLAGYLYFFGDMSRAIADGSADAATFTIRWIGSFPSQVLGFFVSAFLVARAMKQIWPEDAKSTFDQSRAITLVLLALAASLGMLPINLLISSYTQRELFSAVSMTVNLLLSIPFLVAIPLVIDRGVKPMVAATKSIRMMMPVYWRALMLIAFANLLFLCLGTPIAMVAFPLMKPNDTMAWPLIVGFGVLSCVWQPFYYILVALIYRDRIEVSATALPRVEAFTDSQG